MDYGQVTVNGVVVLLLAREFFNFLGKRKTGSGGSGEQPVVFLKAEFQTIREMINAHGAILQGMTNILSEISHTSQDMVKVLTRLEERTR